MTDISSTRLADLWTRQLAGEDLTGDERGVLADAFAADEVFRRRVLHDHHLEGALRAEASLQRQQDRQLAAMQQLLRAASRSDRFIARLRPRLESAAYARQSGAERAERHRAWTRRTFFASAAVAAGLVIALVSMRPAGPPASRETLARRSAPARVAQAPAGAPATTASQVAGIAARGQSRGPLDSPLVVNDVRRAVLVTGADDTHDAQTTLDQGTGDDRLRTQLEQLGFEVAVLSADEPLLEEARRAQVVVLSPSVATRNLSEELVTMAVPIVALESSAFSWLGLTGPAWTRDLGHTPAQLTDVVIEDSTQPLAAGLSGQVPVFSRRQRLRWGVPGPHAIQVATYPGAPAQHSLLFAYERGALTPGGSPAAGRRVAMFLGNGRIIRRLAVPGWRLFDAAVTWAAEDTR